MIDPNKCLKYKGFFGSVEYSAEDNLLCGEILGIDGLFMYHGEALKDLQEDFKEAVESYLAYCEEKGVQPQRMLAANYTNISPKQ
ncbi:MAG: toxin-antitoxin system HicB family antitoxin [Defluviitaleaceae bacterium]|nr:toxin-antitoxin system HicB family antitoxin [Defluviitaleaceae bacterium]